MKATAIILAAGIGKRMKSNRPKQYLALNGVPILTRTLSAFDDHPEINAIILVAADKDISFIHGSVLAGKKWKTNITVTAGGSRRQDSVLEGLKAARGLTGDDDIVLVHDGVRPFVTRELITACISGAVEAGACIPGIPASDTLKRIDERDRVTATVARESIRLVQTPQAFLFRLLREGFEHAVAQNLSVTDDAGVIEAMGLPVKIVPGNPMNMKITTPEDLAVAEALLGNELPGTGT